ncbi:AEC family transporter, partial [Burkholderia cenocepacia]|nr:AEC family transporter [Burkholderia cenocepacia]
STAFAAALLLLVRRFVRVDGAGFTSVFQGAVRFNNYVGTALAAGLFGAKGIALAAVCVAANAVEPTSAAASGKTGNDCSRAFARPSANSAGS